jgi:hypothetical protein
MPARIPNEWLSDPPQYLLAGDGPYAAALASLLRTVSLRLDDVHAGPNSMKASYYPRVLDDIRTLVLVVPEEMRAPEALYHHQCLWDWIEKLTRGKDCHASGFVFVLGTEAPAKFDHALATSLAVPAVDPIISGHAIWRRSGALQSLLELLRQTAHKDLQALRGRRAADIRRKSLVALAVESRSGTDERALLAAATKVADAFRGREYDLDLFCLPPCHRNGNLLRAWLRHAVTGPVTPETRRQGGELLASVLP